MIRRIAWSTPLIALLLSVPSTGANAAPAPAHVRVLRTSAHLYRDGTVGVSVRARCQPGLQAFELDVDAVQGAVEGSTLIVEPAVIPCDRKPHRVRVRFPPNDGVFVHGAATVDVFFGVFDPDEGDLGANATAVAQI